MTILEVLLGVIIVSFVLESILIVALDKAAVNSGKEIDRVMKKAKADVTEAVQKELAKEAQSKQMMETTIEELKKELSSKGKGFESNDTPTQGNDVDFGQFQSALDAQDIAISDMKQHVQKNEEQLKSLREKTKQGLALAGKFVK